jgi:aromatic ring-opening dioxygenase LigB subunit
MIPFVFSCITPHGGELIPELTGSNPDRMNRTRENMKKLGFEMEKANPEVIILLTPHGTRIDRQFSISNSERMIGHLEENNASFSMERSVDRELAEAIYNLADEKGLPAGKINYGTSAGPYSCLPLDWGAIVPLRFMPDVPVVIITPSREISFENHVAFGNVIKQVAEATKKRIGLIASCDWSHAHDEQGPYGFHPDAKKLDEEVLTLIKKNQLESMMEFDPAYIENAKPDGIWQTLILAGAIPYENRNAELLSYEAPTYFGLICTAYYQDEER